MRRKKGGMVRRILDHYLRDEINRLNDLETGIRVLVDSPSYVHGQDAGFNGIAGRKRMFRELLETCDFQHIIETGTYLGDTAGYMALASGIPVWTCELNPSLYRLAKMRLKSVPSVHLHNMDSRRFLSRLAADPDVTGKGCFIYLDAHWGEDNPLREEISLIASHWDRFVVMIDDFEVPGDGGYAHDDYGTLKHIGMPRLDRDHDLRVYFPRMPSGEEAVRPTGCAVMAKNDPFGARLDEVKSLRRYRSRSDPALKIGGRPSDE